MRQEDDIYLKIKKSMEEYDLDFNGALRRSEEIAEDERLRAVHEIDNWKKLERFGLII